MNDRIQHAAGQTKLTVPIWLEDATTGALRPNVTITDLDYRYIRVGADNDVTISDAADVAVLDDLDADHADGKMYEIDEGAYRFDVPDAAVVAGAKYVAIKIWDAANDSVLPAIQEIELTSWEKAAKTLVNKAVQNKSTGAIQYYDDDGETVILTLTPTDGEITFTRTPS